jgi:hypothetical protein
MATIGGTISPAGFYYVMGYDMANFTSYLTGTQEYIRLKSYNFRAETDPGTGVWSTTEAVWGHNYIFMAYPYGSNPGYACTFYGDTTDLDSAVEFFVADGNPTSAINITCQAAPNYIGGSVSNPPVGTTTTTVYACLPWRDTYLAVAQCTPDGVSEGSLTTWSAATVAENEYMVYGVASDGSSALKYVVSDDLNETGVFQYSIENGDGTVGIDFDADVDAAPLVSVNYQSVARCSKNKSHMVDVHNNRCGECRSHLKTVMGRCPVNPKHRIVIAFRGVPYCMECFLGGVTTVAELSEGDCTLYAQQANPFTQGDMKDNAVKAGPTNRYYL